VHPIDVVGAPPEGRRRRCTSPVVCLGATRYLRSQSPRVLCWGEVLVPTEEPTCLKAMTLISVHRERADIKLVWRDAPMPTREPGVLAAAVSLSAFGGADAPLFRCKRRCGCRHRRQNART